MSDSPFTRGAPTPEQVREHIKNHALNKDPKFALRLPCAQWIVIDEEETYQDPQFIRLKIGAQHDVKHGNDPKDIIGQVVVQNGYAFWQPLLLCKWAQRSLYLPVSRRGLPL